MTAPDSTRGAGPRPPKGRIGPQRALFDNPVGSISMEEVAPAARQAGEDAVRAWAPAARLDLAGSDSIPLAIIAAYNRAHPDRPY